MQEYRPIDISAWTKVGEGGNGAVYRNPSEPDVILKLNKAGLNTLSFVTREYEVSKAVENLGLQTPRTLEIVRVGDAYATVSELIRNKKSLSRICSDEPARTEEMAEVLCQHFKQLSTTPCNTDFFPDRKAQLLRALDKVQFIGRKNREILKAYAQTVPDATTCSHGDLNMGNLVQSDDRYLWIDLGRFGSGSPMFDIGHLFQICNVYASMKQVQDIFHMPEEQLRRFWDAFARAYTGQEDHAEFDRLAGHYACLDMVVRYELQTPSLPEKIFFAIKICQLVKSYFL